MKTENDIEKELSLIGKNIEIARGIAISNGYNLRVQEKDGEHLISICNFDPSRINVATINDLVTKILGRG